MAKGWIKKAISPEHKGVEIDKAKRNGVSTHEQLETDSHSSNSTTRARGNLGLRFEKGGDLHKGKSRPEHRYRNRSM